MAVVFIDGFDAYNGVVSTTTGNIRTGWGPVGDSVGIVTGRFGGQAVKNGGGSGTTNVLGKSISPLTQGTLGFAIKFTSMPTNASWPCLVGLADSTSGIAIHFATDGSLKLISSTNMSTASTTYATTSAGLIVVNTWYYVELEFTIANAGGILNLYLNGTQVSSGTYDTQVGTAATVSTLYLGSTNSLGIGIYNIDDLYLTNTPTKLGEQRVETLYPNADTAQKQWTASTGVDNYAMVDETLMSVTDYVSSNTIGSFDLYDFGNLTSTPSSINAVVVNALMQKDNIGTRAIAATIKSGSITLDGSNVYLNTGYNLNTRVLETDPNTSGAWTASAVNSIQAGVKVTI